MGRARVPRSNAMSTPSLVEDIFLAAVDKATPQERAAYLDEACRGDAELRRRVERLLAAHPRAVDFLDQPAADLGQTVDSEPGQPDHGATGGHRPEPDEVSVHRV